MIRISYTHIVPYGTVPDAFIHLRIGNRSTVNARYIMHIYSAGLYFGGGKTKKKKKERKMAMASSSTQFTLPHKKYVMYLHIKYTYKYIYSFLCTVISWWYTSMRFVSMCPLLKTDIFGAFALCICICVTWYV